MNIHSAFLDIPLEIRLAIYEIILDNQRTVIRQQQPSNHSLSLLRTSKQIQLEAGPIFRKYVSLRDELAIERFCNLANEQCTSAILWADVANDSRLLESPESPGKLEPLSMLYQAMTKMPNLEQLRVFNDRRRSVNRSFGAARIHLAFEEAIFPAYLGPPPVLKAYELMLDPKSRASPFTIINPISLSRMTLSGDLHLNQSRVMVPALRHLTLHGVNSNRIDQVKLNDWFSGSDLSSFTYSKGHSMGFDLMDSHITSIPLMSISGLKRLTLIGCSRITSEGLSKCLRELRSLQHCALSDLQGLKNVEEHQFIAELSPTVSVFKISISHPWHMNPRLLEEASMCEAVETYLLKRLDPPRALHLDFHQGVMREDMRQQRWELIAQTRHIDLFFGYWPGFEII